MAIFYFKTAINSIVSPHSVAILIFCKNTMSENKTILVVEDNDFVRMQIVKFLNDAGFITVESKDGEEAIEKMTEDISMAIVDIRMEPMGGFEFVRTIRGFQNDTPAILVTGDNDPEILTEASKLNIAAVLMKPVEKDRLIKTVERTLRINTQK